MLEHEVAPEIVLGSDGIAVRLGSLRLEVGVDTTGFEGGGRVERVNVGLRSPAMRSSCVPFEHAMNAITRKDRKAPAII